MSIIALAAGGTAGHINPALALAEELRDRGHDVRFYGTDRGMEATMVPEQGFAFEGLDVTGFQRTRPWTAVTTMTKSRAARKRILEDFAASGRPAAAVGFGAYVAVPLANAATESGIPLVIHEQNSVPGMANKTLAKDAAVLALGYPAAKVAFADRIGPTTQVIVCGNPVRRSVLAPTREEGRSKLDIPDEDCVLLIFGGSLGALHINQTAVRLKDTLLSRPHLSVIHATGKRDYDEISAELALSDAEAARWHLLPYIDDMGSCLAASDVVFSRAGASSVAEIAARCVPSMLIPFPQATANHQALNASYLVDAGGALVMDDEALDSAAFDEALLGLLDEPERRAAMRHALEGLESSQAAARLADAVEQAAEAACDKADGSTHR